MEYRYSPFGEAQSERPVVFLAKDDFDQTEIETVRSKKKKSGRRKRSNKSKDKQKLKDRENREDQDDE